jgi:uncharacterized membrane protein
MVKQKSRLKEMMDEKKSKERQVRRIKEESMKKNLSSSSWKTGIFSLLIVAVLLILTYLLNYSGIKKFIYFLCMIVLAVTGILAGTQKRYGWLVVEILFFILAIFNFARA